MPQFDFAHVFWPQLIWLLLSFAVLYFGVVRLTLPRLGKVVDARASQIAGDLAAAKAAKADADAHHLGYQAELEGAREKARGEIAEAKLAAARRRLVMRAAPCGVAGACIVRPPAHPPGHSSRAATARTRVTRTAHLSGRTDSAARPVSLIF